VCLDVKWLSMTGALGVAASIFHVFAPFAGRKHRLMISVEEAEATK